MDENGEMVDVPEPDELEQSLTGDMPEAGGEVDGLSDEALEPETSSTESPFEAAMNVATRTPNKSLREIEQSEYFDPELGGTNRLLLVFDDVISEGDGMQNWMHVCVACFEIMVNGGLDEMLDQSSEEPAEEPETDTVLTETETEGLDIA